MKTTRLALCVILTGGPAATARSAGPGDLAGTWKGSATLRSEGAAAACEYVGAADPGAVTLQILPAGERYRGRLTLDIPASRASCPALRTQQELESVTVTESSVAFRDPAGHDWNLGLRSDALVGLVAWKGPASGTAAPRLSGEVALRRTSSERSGSGLGGVAAVLAANVVGIGAFALVNVVTNDDSAGGQGGQATCSPRVCVFFGLTDPCTCTINVVSGSSCLATTGGASAGSTCNAASLPCQAGLSCNNGVCEDAGGRCPF